MNSLERDSMRRFFRDDADDVHDRDTILHTLVERFCVEKVAADRMDGLHAQPKRIVAHQRAHAIFAKQQFVDDGAADEPAASGHKNPTRHRSDSQLKMQSPRRAARKMESEGLTMASGDSPSSIFHLPFSARFGGEFLAILALIRGDWPYTKDRP
jgi:hypothetical protein